MSVATAPPAAAVATCTFNGQPAGSAITVTPGTTTIAVSCTGLTASSTFAIADASPLAGVLQGGDQAAQLNLTMGGLAGGGVALANSDAAGNLSANFAIPATTVGANTDGTCPPSQAQVDAGLTNCALAVADLTGAQQGLVLLNYPGQPTPSAPTLSLDPTTGPSGTTVTVSGDNWWNSGITDTPITDITVGAVAATTSTAHVPASTYTLGGGLNGSGGTLTGGDLTGTFDIPGGAPSGTQDVVVTETNTHPPNNAPYTAATISATSSFTVEAPPAEVIDDSVDAIVNGPIRSAATSKNIVAKVTNLGTGTWHVCDTNISWTVDAAGDFTPLTQGCADLGPGASRRFRFQWTYGSGGLTPDQVVNLTASVPVREGDIDTDNNSNTEMRTVR